MLTVLSTMRHALGALTAGAALCAVGLFSASAQDTKKSEKPEISEGIEGKVKSVDHEKGTLSIIPATGKERTFKITDETTMIGPRGGKVRKRLKDKRFHEGMELTVVADGASATEIHLGFSRKDSGDSSDTKPAMKRSALDPRSQRGDAAIDAAKTKAPEKVGKLAKEAAAKVAAGDDSDGEDDEIPGKVKSFDAARRILVVALLNGKSRSFFLARDTKVVVKGTTSKQGLKDAALKDGAAINVFVEAGGRRVKELHVTPAPAGKSKTAA